MPPEVTAVPVLVDGFSLTVNGLVVDGEPTIQECEQAGVALCIAEKAAPFALGDFVNYVEVRFNEAAAQIIDPGNGWSLKTVKLYSWVARQIPASIRRMDRLGIRHHMMVAKDEIPLGKRKYWLDKAADSEGEPWTVARMAKAVSAGEDLPITKLWVLVMASDLDDQVALMALLESQGRSVKAVTRREKKGKV